MVVAEVMVVEVTVVAELLVDSARGIGGGRGVVGDIAGIRALTKPIHTRLKPV